MTRKILAAIIFIILLVVAAKINFLRNIPTDPSLLGGEVGFFSPSGLTDEVILKTQFGLINAASPTQVEDNLKRASKTAFKVSIDFGPVITSPADPAKLDISYRTSNGQARTKKLAAQEQSKLRVISTDSELKKQLAPYLDVIARYPKNVGTLFLADEPYLNGITKAEMERAANVTRQELKTRRLENIKIGVIFASGMFDSQFAKMIDERSSSYVGDIDKYYKKGNDSNSKEFKSWVDTIKKNRLATYDRAGNLYVEGGLPSGYDVYGFDFYLSTLLLDNLLEHTLEWLAVRYPNQYGCGQFVDQPIQKIRSRLSFFHNDAIRQGESYQIADRKILDAIYECRMGAITDMLKASTGNSTTQLLMISESSNNGVFEFDPAGNIKSDQPNLLVESRVVDEVMRAQSFYRRNINIYSAGLMYFTHQDEYDYSINLHIGGASSMPSVMTAIYTFSGQVPVPH